MKLEVTKKINISVGQEFYGIVCVSRYTYDGIQPIRVRDIDWDEEQIVFIDTKHKIVLCCHFDEFEKYVFETKEEAEQQMKNLDFGLGLYAY